MKHKDTEPVRAVVAVDASPQLPAGIMPLGLDLPEDLPLERWQAIGQQLRGIEGSMRWWIGDWLNFGERSYGKGYKAAEKATGYDNGTLRNLKSVAAKFELSRRRDNLSW